MLFAVREVGSESLGFIPSEFEFVLSMCGPVKLLKQKCRGRVQPKNCWICVALVLSCARLVNYKNLKAAQNKMEDWYDTEAKKKCWVNS